MFNKAKRDIDNFYEDGKKIKKQKTCEYNMPELNEFHLERPVKLDSTASPCTLVEWEASGSNWKVS